MRDFLGGIGDFDGGRRDRGDGFAQTLNHAVEVLFDFFVVAGQAIGQARGEIASRNTVFAP